LKSKISFEMGSAPVSGAVRRVSRRTFAVRTTQLKIVSNVAVRLADETSTRARETRVLSK
jgi:hypothetical protein